MRVPPATRRRRNLPHWRVPGAWYFVTWSLKRPQADLTPVERTMVANGLGHFDGDRYELKAWVVMHDHVHVIVRPFAEWDLSQLLHSWKSFTAHQMVKIHGRRAPVWEVESYDRVVRDEAELVKFTRYIETNPARRWPGCGRYDWCWVRS